MQNPIPPSNPLSDYGSNLYSALSAGNWDLVYQVASDWFQAEPASPAAKFFQNYASFFINPPSIIRFTRYLDRAGNKDRKAVLDWYSELKGESDLHNPHFQAIDFILRATPQTKDGGEQAQPEQQGNAELLFLQAISQQDRNFSVRKLKLAIAEKPIFPAALYLLGIFSIQLKRINDAQGYLIKAVEQAPDFMEAHYQLGSLFSLYVPDSAEKARQHLQRVVELDPDGGAGKDAARVLEGKGKPRFGQRMEGGTGAQRGGLSLVTIVAISLLTVALFSGPIANFLKISNPLIGIIAGLFVFIGLYSANSKKK